MPAVTHHESAHRFEMETPHGVALIDYDRRDDGAAFVHTEVPEQDQGQGRGEALVRGALDQAREMGWVVVPLCPFVRAFIAGHPDYADLVPAADRARMGLG